MVCGVAFQGCSSICLAAEDGDWRLWSVRGVLGCVRVWSPRSSFCGSLSVYSWLLKHMQKTAVPHGLRAGLADPGLDLRPPPARDLSPDLRSCGRICGVWNKLCAVWKMDTNTSRWPCQMHFFNFAISCFSLNQKVKHAETNSSFCYLILERWRIFVLPLLHSSPLSPVSSSPPAPCEVESWNKGIPCLLI